MAPSRPREVVWDVLLWAALVATAAADSRQWAELTAIALWSALVVGTSRRWPALALLSGSAVHLVGLSGVSDYEYWAALLSVVAGVLGGRRMADTQVAAAVFVAVGVTGALVGLAVDNLWDGVGVVLSLLVFGVLPWLAGRYARLRSMLADAGWQRAEQLERERRLVAGEARLRERTHIARDMHDSLGHELSLIAMRAGALELDRGLDERYRAAVGQLRAESVEASERLRDIVRVLRDRGESARLEPAGESVGDLVARSRASGMDVELLSTGTAGDVAPAVDRTAYRVVQEALTNAAKHAPGAPVTVRQEYGETALAITVTSGPAATGARSVPGEGGRSEGGRGLLGLRERVRLVGGTLCADARPDGFEVVARLLYAAADAADAAERADAAGRAGAGTSESARRLAQLRGTVRRGLAAAVAVAVSIGLVAVLVILVLRWYEVRSSFLDPAAYDALRVGQQRTEIAGQLPRRQVDGRPDVPEPAAPAGARCEYYRPTRDMFRGPIDVYRLCFADGRIVDKTVVAGTAP